MQQLITEIENILRLIIIDVIGDKDDSPYLVSKERVLSWKEKRNTEEKKYKGILHEKRLIYYSDFYDLTTIIHKNWNLFLAIFKDKKRFDVFLKDLEKFRNTLSHGRSLTSSEESLIRGIVGELKNQITIYHNKNEMKEDYFIRIIKVSDNLGNTWPNSEYNQVTLRVGDEYELIVLANDPKDREIKYRLSILGKGEIVKNQISNVLKFKVTKNHIGKLVNFIVIASTPDSEYENAEHISIIATIFPN